MKRLWLTVPYTAERSIKTVPYNHPFLISIFDVLCEVMGLVGD